MITKCFKNDKEDIKQAAVILKNGGLVAFPTETVYGLGANAFDETAVLNIFKAKGRPADNPLIVHIYSENQLSEIVSEIPKKAKILMDKFWPGPLTIVMKKSDNIPNIVSAGLNTVAVRMPVNETAFNLLKECNLPIAAPSANTSGKPSPTTFKHVFEDMNGKIDAVIDGGNCEVGVESTVIDLTEDIPMLLRPGGITLEQLIETLGEVKCAYEYKDGTIPKSPGMKYKHYAPKAKVIVVRGNLQKYINKHCNNYNKIGILSYNNINLPNNAVYKFFGNNSREYASNLFKYLREFDELGVDVIFAEDIDDKGINLAVRNRLYKSAGYTIAEE